MTTLPTATAPARPADRPSLPLTPRRGLALLVGIPVAACLIAITGFQFVAQLGKASFPVSRTWTLSHQKFTLHTDGGDVSLQGTAAAGSTARLDGNVSYSLVRPKVFYDDGASGAGIRLGCPLAALTGCGLNGHVDLPAGTEVTATTGGGNVSVRDMSGTVSLRTDGGDVNAVDLTGRVVLTSGGGNVSVERLSGDTTLRTDGGDITGTGITAGTVKATTGGGNVGLTFTDPPKNLNVHTDGGDVTIFVPRTVGYVVITHTDGGDVNAFPSSGTSYTITATTGGGNITIQYTS